ASSIVFETNENGQLRQVVARPWSVNAGGTSAKVVVPAEAVTGSVRLVGDANATALFLQVVPKLTGLDVTYVPGDGSYASITLRGSGFIEGANSVYTLGDFVRTDSGSGSD
ncbi:MAG TPA: hypothetical protein PLF63_14100, partial [Rubrivivax sp.]|nr:hypothetical protein [Rubrivivax sp.]